MRRSTIVSRIGVGLAMLPLVACLSYDWSMPEGDDPLLAAGPMGAGLPAQSSAPPTQLPKPERPSDAGPASREAPDEPEGEDAEEEQGNEGNAGEDPADNQQPPPPAVKNCAAAGTKAECAACCGETAQTYAAASAAMQACVCTGACGALCAKTDRCNGGRGKRECDDCIGTQCVPVYFRTCEADPACAVVDKCVYDSGCNAKP